MFTGRELCSDGPEVNIGVPGHSDRLSMPSVGEEIKVEPLSMLKQVVTSTLHWQMLTLAQHQLDMMHSIVVRLEEIIDSS